RGKRIELTTLRERLTATMKPRERRVELLQFEKQLLLAGTGLHTLHPSAQRLPRSPTDRYGAYSPGTRLRVVSRPGRARRHRARATRLPSARHRSVRGRLLRATALGTLAPDGA